MNYIFFKGNKVKTKKIPLTVEEKIHKFVLEYNAICCDYGMSLLPWSSDGYVDVSLKVWVDELDGYTEDDV